jgi:hypothetical protein
VLNERSLCKKNIIKIIKLAANDGTLVPNDVIDARACSSQSIKHGVVTPENLSSPC